MLISVIQEYAILNLQYYKDGGHIWILDWGGGGGVGCGMGLVLKRECGSVHIIIISKGLVG
jgi:hypothetical protein